MTELHFAGLRSRPLASYLAAIGLFRVVADQVDREARSSWQNGTFVLDSTLTSDGLRSFLVDDYRPSPLVGPWNGSDQGGFRPGAETRASKLIAQIEGSTLARMAGYRTAMGATRRVVMSKGWQAANTAKDKATMVLRLRNELPDSAVQFLDAAVALTSAKPEFPLILGTGGNIGRLDLVTNFMEHIERVTDEANTRLSIKWLDEVLLGTSVPGVKASPGQYDYAGAGGVNQGRSGPAPERVNPWMYLLSIEGTLAFAATATRRLGSQRSKASAPFTVAASASGYASTARGESAKGEMWMPLWERPWTQAELASVLNEGRAVWSGGQARDGTDLLRAIRTLGVDRGIGAFERYSFLERHGQSPTAIATGRIRVHEDERVRLTAELDRWIRSLNRGSDDRVPAAVRVARNRVGHALHRCADRAAPSHLLNLLTEVANAERAVSRSSGFRKTSAIEPVPELSGAWTKEFHCLEPEFLIARLLAGGHDRRQRGDDDDPMGSLREFLRPIRVDRFGRPSALRERGAVVPGMASRPVLDLLADVAVLRCRTAPEAPERQRPPIRGTRPQFTIQPGESDRRAPAWLAEAVASGGIDVHRLVLWLDALMLVKPDDSPPPIETEAEFARPQPLWRVLAPWFAQATLSDRRSGVRIPQEDEGGWSLVPVVRPTWGPRLRYGQPTQVKGVLREVCSAYAASGLDAAFSPEALVSDGAASQGLPSSALLAALLIPTRLRDLAALTADHVRINQGASQ